MSAIAITMSISGGLIMAGLFAMTSAMSRDKEMMNNKKGIWIMLAYFVILFFVGTFISIMPPAYRIVHPVLSVWPVYFWTAMGSGLLIYVVILKTQLRVKVVNLILRTNGAS